MSTSYSEAQRQDWQNRDFIEIISRNVKKIADFLNHFDQSCRGRLADLNEKMTHLERKVDFLEASITSTCLSHQQQQAALTMQSLTTTIDNDDTKSQSRLQ